MKKVIFTTFLFIATSISISAQPPQGGGPGGEMRGSGGMPGRGHSGPPSDMRSTANEDYWVENLSIIEGLTLDQKNKLSDLLVKEKKDISKQFEKKTGLPNVF